jgi:hypothetical protein
MTVDARSGVFICTTLEIPLLPAAARKNRLGEESYA